MTSGFDPQRLPVLGIDCHLPAVPRERLSAAALRERFACPPAWQPEITAEPLLSARTAVPAAVLIPLMLRKSLTVLLTVRSDQLSDHAGQISFPGGRTDAGDATPTATAVREAHEEIGLAAKNLHVLGSLPPYTTVTGFIVTPVVALVQPAFVPRIDQREVADVFEVPLAYLMAPANHRRHRVGDGTHQREFFSMPWHTDAAQEASKCYFIWGATAAILRNFYCFLSA